MRSLILASAACVALSCAASAADLPTKAPAAAPALAPAFTWTGFYIGAHAGAMIHNGDLALVGPGLVDPVHGAAPPDYAINPDLNTTGFKGGLLAGYNYQIGSAVLGLEADVGFGNTSGTVNSAKREVPMGIWRAENAFTQKINAHIRGRVGYVWGSTLLYAAGGFATTNSELKITGYCPDDPPYVYRANVKHSLQGYTLGAGVDHALTSNILLRAEYLFDDFGKQTYRAGPEWQPRAVNLQTHTIRAALSYKF